MFRYSLLLGLVAFFFPASFAPAQTAPVKLGDPEVAQLLAIIRPTESEDPFATIPWQTSLWDARKLAAKEGKPILLWEMDGHPLGCG